jgi:hypothetical protein
MFSQAQSEWLPRTPSPPPRKRSRCTLRCVVPPALRTCMANHHTNAGTRATLAAICEMLLYHCHHLCHARPCYPPCPQEREAFNPLSFLYNPMVLMMLVSVFFMVVMPKMLPEDVMKEMEQTQAQMGSGNPMDMLKKALSGEGMAGEEDDGPSEPSSSSGGGSGAVARRKKR